MTENEINVAIAEACGWTNVHHPKKSPEGYLLGTFPGVDGTETHHKCVVPNYTHDLDAMHEAEKGLNEEQRYKYTHALLSQPGINYGGVEPIDFCFPVLHATARQRAEAFLRTVGRWKETKP